MWHFKYINNNHEQRIPIEEIINIVIIFLTYRWFKSWIPIVIPTINSTIFHSVRKNY